MIQDLSDTCDLSTCQLSRHPCRIVSGSSSANAKTLSIEVRVDRIVYPRLRNYVRTFSARTRLGHFPKSLSRPPALARDRTHVSSCSCFNNPPIALSFRLSSMRLSIVPALLLTLLILSLSSDAWRRRRRHIRPPTAKVRKNEEQTRSLMKNINVFLSNAARTLKNFAVSSKSFPTTATERDEYFPTGNS